jgi:hypothetical protein
MHRVEKDKASFMEVSWNKQVLTFPSNEIKWDHNPLKDKRVECFAQGGEFRFTMLFSLPSLKGPGGYLKN